MQKKKKEIGFKIRNTDLSNFDKLHQQGRNHEKF